MATKKELEEIIIRVDERTKVIPGIEKHLRDLNGVVSDTIAKLAKTEQISKNSSSKADSNRHYLDKITIAVIASIITALGSIIAVAISL